MIEEDIDDEYLDDPIRLFDSEQNRVFFRPLTKEVVIEDSDDVDDTGFKKQQIEHNETLYSYESNSTILPVTFFDIDSNVDLLKRCRPLSIKLVDCDKYPWYSKNNTDSTKHNNLNSDKTILQEADCIEIMSSDENYDLILERTTLEDISNFNKELNIIRFESENKSMVKQRFEKVMRKEYNRNSFKNKNNVDLKRNKGVIGLKISQTNFMIDAKSDKRKANLLSYDSSNFEDTYVDKIDTYARLIDIAYQKLQDNNNKPPASTEHETYIKTDKDSGKLYKKHQNKFKTNESPGTIKLDDKKPTKNNLNDCTEIKSHVSPKLLKSNNKNKIINVIIEEPQLKECVLDNNNGSSSPLLPCPTHRNNNNNTKITILSDTTFPSNTKQSIKKNNVCKNHLFSANRVIPHYHNELMQGAKKIKPSKVSQDISKNSTENNDVLQTHFTYPACKVNDFNHNNQSLLKERNNNKQNRLINVNVNDINNLAYDNCFKSNTNQIPSLNRLAPNLSTGQCTSHPNFSQQLITHKIKRGKERSIQPEVAKSVSLLDATKGSNNHSIPVVSNISVLLRQKPQLTNQNNFNQPTFPIQRIISNRDHFQTNNFIITPEYPNAMSNVQQQQCIQNVSQNNICQNHINNNCYTSENNLSVTTQSLQTSAIFYGYRAPSLYVNSQKSLNTINRLPQINNGQIPYTNIKYYINDHENILNIKNAIKNNTISNIESQTVAAFLATEVNKRTSTAVEKTKRNVGRGTSAYADKHPHLKQSLEEPPLKMNKTDAMNMRTEQRICRNNDDGIKLKHNINNSGNRISTDNVNKNITLLSNGNTSNISKETMKATLLATTAYVNQKPCRMEENTKYKVENEASPRVNNSTHLKKSLEQLPLKSKTNFMTTKNNQKIDQNNIISINPVSKGYSPPILPIPTYQKTFEILAKIKLYDLEKDSNQPEPNNVIEASASPQNLRKRKIGETEKVSRKITINEYKKRLSAMESINLEDYEVNIL